MIILACAEPSSSALKTWKHHLVTSFIERGAKVCYVEVPINILAYVWTIIIFAPCKLFAVDGSLINFRPISIFPNSKKISGIFDNRFLFLINNFFIDLQFKSLLKKLGRPKFKFICYLPIGTSFLHERSDETILHVVDEWDGLSSMSNCLKDEIKKYFFSSDKVIFASATLKKQFFKKLSYRNNTIVLKHGLGFEPNLYAPRGVVNRKINVKEENVTFGYYGAFSKLDLNLILKTVTSLPQYKFVMVGPEHDLSNNLEYKSVKNKLINTKNLLFQGELPHQKIPDFICDINALWLPFKRNKLTEKMSPIKIYEGLSLGVPIVSTSLEGVYEIGGDKITYADTWEENKEALIKCANYKTIETSFEYSKGLNFNSWLKISQEFLSEIQDD